MKIGLISDTHSPAFGATPPWQVEKAFEGVDLILHAGDIYSKKCLDWLEANIAPVIAVEFPGPYLGTIPNVFEKRVVESQGNAIGMVHDLTLHGMEKEPFPGVLPDYYPKDGTFPNAMGRYFGQSINIVVFGHTHVPVLEEHQGVLAINPGSPNLPNHFMKLGTVALLDISSEGGVSARIVDLSDFG